MAFSVSLKKVKSHSDLKGNTLVFALVVLPDTSHFLSGLCKSGAWGCCRQASRGTEAGDRRLFPSFHIPMCIRSRPKAPNLGLSILLPS